MKPEWKFERSSGHAGWRCQNCSHWIYDGDDLDCNCTAHDPINTMNTERETPETDEMNRQCNTISWPDSFFLARELCAKLERERDEASDKLKHYEWQDIETDGLPEYMTAVNVWCPENENVFCAYYYFYSGSQDANRIPIWAFFDSTERIIRIEQKVTHWMGLPPKP